MSDIKKLFKRTRWHRILGTVLKEWLTPVGITVHTEVPVMTEPPKLDILLLKNNHKGNTELQRERLASGLRDCKADTLIIEFKYTESVNSDTLALTGGYDAFYRRAHDLSRNEVHTFILSSKTPRAETLKSHCYQETGPGVYTSSIPMLSHLTIIVLNDLTNEPYNVVWKCFASRREEMRKAYKSIHKSWRGKISVSLEWLLDGLWSILLGGGGNMKTAEVNELTPDYVKSVGKEWVDHLMSVLPAEERLKGLGPKERLEGLGLDERLEGLTPEQLKTLKEKLKDL